jgi:uroporphyrinogen-III synthase
MITYHYCPVKEQRPLTSTSSAQVLRQAQHKNFDLLRFHSAQAAQHKSLKE